MLKVPILMIVMIAGPALDCLTAVLCHPTTKDFVVLASYQKSLAPVRPVRGITRSREINVSMRVLELYLVSHGNHTPENSAMQKWEHRWKGKKKNLKSSRTSQKSKKRE